MDTNTVRFKLTFSFRMNQRRLIDKRRVKKVERITKTKILIEKRTFGRGIICGTELQCQEALCLILESSQRKLNAQMTVSETVSFSTPHEYNKVNKGQTRLAIEKCTGVKIQHDGKSRPLTCIMHGSPDQIMIAKKLLEKVGSGDVDTRQMATTLSALFILMKKFLRRGFRFSIPVPNIEHASLFEEVSTVHAAPEQPVNAMQGGCVAPQMVVTECTVRQTKITQYYNEKTPNQQPPTPIAEQSVVATESHQGTSLPELFAKNFIPGELAELLTTLVNSDEHTLTHVGSCVLQALELLDSTQMDKHTGRDTSPGTPLLIHLPKRTNGSVFTLLIIFLMSADNPFSGPWKLLTPTDGTPRCLYRNCIRFVIPGYPSIITLIDSNTDIEVHIDIHPDQYSEFCPTLCPLLREALMHGIKKFADCRPVLAFTCPCDRGQQDGIHTANLSTPVSGSWICSVDPRRCGKLEDKHQLWLTNETGPKTGAGAQLQCKLVVHVYSDVGNSITSTYYKPMMYYKPTPSSARSSCM